MNRRHFLTLSTLGLGAAALTARATLARRPFESRPPRIVTTKTSAYLIGKVEPVLSGKIGEVAPAPLGRYALAVQELRPEPTPENREVIGEEKLWLYDGLRRTTKLLYRLQDNPTTATQSRMEGITWFPEAKKAVLQQVTSPTVSRDLLQMTSALSLVDIDRGTVRGLVAPTTNRLILQSLAGASSLLCMEFDPKQMGLTRRVCFLSPEGVFTPLVTVGEKGNVAASALSADRKSVIFVEIVLTRVEGQARPQRQNHWYAVRLSDAQVTPLKEKPLDATSFPQETEPSLPLKLIASAAKLSADGGRSATTIALWLEAREPGEEKKYLRGLVTAEASRPYLLADLSAVLYTHDDSLYATAIASLDRVAFAKLQRELTMSRAKQVGLGLMMYMQDYDENLPHDPSNVAEVVMPYLKDAETLADFVYTYKGTAALGKIEKPSETVLGHISSPGGRAVVYADGHVKWELTP